MRTRLVTVFTLLLAIAVMAACGGSSSGPSAPSPTPTPAPTPSPTPSPAPAGCSATVTGLPGTIPVSAARITFSVAVAPNCPWTATVDAPWADVAPGSGTGSASPVFSASLTEARDSRTVIVTINGTRVPVAQQGRVCTFTLSPTSMEANREGGTMNIQVTAAPDCAWTATASEGWIRVLTPGGIGNGTVTLDLQPNPGGTRNAVVTIGGAGVAVRQLGS